MEKTMTTTTINNKVERHATIGADAYPYKPIDMFDCWTISREEGTETDLLARLKQIAETYTKHGYKVQWLKTTECRLQVTHCILVTDVYVKAFNKKMSKLFISVWVDK